MIVHILMLFTLVSSFMEAGSFNEEVHIELKFDSSQKGLIRWAVYDSETSFLKKPWKENSIVSSEGTQFVISANEVPQSYFAVAVFLDVNKNGKLDKNFWGVPTEPYGFSNNKRGKFGPPTWMQARMNKETSLGPIVIELK